MSKFEHSICDTCWNKKNPERIAHKLHEKIREREVCCYCGAPHNSGIFVREDPQSVQCVGRHSN